MIVFGDVHLGSPHSRVEELKKCLASLGPERVAITGDLFEDQYRLVGREEAIRLIAKAMNASNSLLYVNVDGDRYVWFGTNPCAEVPGADKDVCNLTHINLVKFVKEGCSGRTLEEKLECIDWAGLAETARVGVRFLDDAVDISTTGMKDVDETYRKIRKIGLGVMRKSV